MTVLNTVAAKAKAIGSGASSNGGKAESSRESARERLQLLGMGDGTVTRFPAQILPDVRLDDEDDEFQPSSEYPDISGIYADATEKPATWEKEIDNFALEVEAQQTAAQTTPGATDQYDRRVAFSPSLSDPNTLVARRRRVAADQLKHFHIYAGSLVAVLLCSVWMFGFAMFT